MASGGEGGKVRTLELELGSRPRRLKKYLGRPQRSRFGRRLSRSTLDTGGNLGRLRENMQSHSLTGGTCDCVGRHRKLLYRTIHTVQ